MLSEAAFARLPEGEKLLRGIQSMELPGPVCLMEVCGTHTMAIAKAGLRQLLPAGVELRSGPGCPVCVTPAGVMDGVLALSETPGLILTTYGDLMRVPGSTPGDDLQRRRAMGADVRWVYTPMDALELAQAEPESRWCSWAWGSRPPRQAPLWRCRRLSGGTSKTFPCCAC